MATILLTWELGLAMGHVGVLRPLAEALMQKGHRVVAALKDVTQARHLSLNGAIPCLQAPIRLNAVRSPYQLPSTFAHILHNAGFGSVEELRPMVDAWRALYDLIQPDLILLEHSPTALLASFGREMKRVNIGTGFCCPPDRTPLPDWRPYLKNDPARLAREEESIRAVLGEMLVASAEKPPEKLTDLYTRADETVLTTFPELDHFGARAGARYWGAWSSGMGSLPQWPSAEGRRVFGYLKPFAALPALLETLASRRLPTLIYGPEIDPQLKSRLQCATLRFADRPVDLAAAGKWCDFAISNATHATTAAILLAGKPILQIPLFLEQQLTADNVVRMGAGVAADQNQAAHVIAQLEKILADDKCIAPAQDFSRRHAGFDWRQELANLSARIDEML